MVEFAVCETGDRLRRWKGESMLNSSWILSLAAGMKGVSWLWCHSEISTWKCCEDVSEDTR
jgi:hypothetical protein